ncbi:MAG TPA: 6,7-dimethyl-8-ribityllumazine synthase [Oligoflexia bacterium]|nr:6,7-dimethyl-8-ribityllumazine synthase [Oligoflexia bacterium]HMR24330.1 6,7-dimethyl-8-ribityllumazine synthase [Oligoflexia bacterium]
MKTEDKHISNLHQEFGPYAVALIKASWHQDLLKQVSEQVKKTTKAIDPTSTLDEFEVAGTLEIPQMLAFIAKYKKYDAVVVTGCVIRGETSHYEHICDTVFPAIDQIAREYTLPVGNAILSVENMAQAQARVNGEHGRKGEEACHAALLLAQTYREIKASQ